jgi:hypothetical protein
LVPCLRMKANPKSRGSILYESEFFLYYWILVWGIKLTKYVYVTQSI